MTYVRTIALLGALTVAALLWPRLGKPDDASDLLTSQPHAVLFTYVPALFQHDQQPVGPASGFRAKTLPQLGIVVREYESDTGEDGKLPWERLNDYVHYLNSANPTVDRYKILFVARHGEGK